MRAISTLAAGLAPGGARSRQRPKVGLALSGGGARGLAHIGVLKILEREGIPIDFLAGTSMGGMIAAGYASGLDAERLEQEALRIGRLSHLIEFFDRILLTKPGLFEGQRVQRYLVEWLGDMTFDDLRTPLALVAVDLERGEEVILKSGSVVEAVRATISLPGLFAPFRLNGRLLIDGGVLNNLPAGVVRGMGADIVIAVDVGLKLEDLPSASEERGLPLTQIPLIITILHRTLCIMEGWITAQKLAASRPEVLIEPALGDDFGIFSFNRAAECIAAGEEAATAALPKL